MKHQAHVCHIGMYQIELLNIYKKLKKIVIATKMNACYKKCINFPPINNIFFSPIAKPSLNGFFPNIKMQKTNFIQCLAFLGRSNFEQIFSLSRIIINYWIMQKNGAEKWAFVQYGIFLVFGQSKSLSFSSIISDCGISSSGKCRRTLLRRYHKDISRYTKRNNLLTLLTYLRHSLLFSQ